MKIIKGHYMPYLPPLPEGTTGDIFCNYRHKEALLHVQKQDESGKKTIYTLAGILEWDEESQSKIWKFYAPPQAPYTEPPPIEGAKYRVKIRENFPPIFREEEIGAPPCAFFYAHTDTLEKAAAEAAGWRYGKNVEIRPIKEGEFTVFDGDGDEIAYLYLRLRPR